MSKGYYTQDHKTVAEAFDNDFVDAMKALTSTHSFVFFLNKEAS